ADFDGYRAEQARREVAALRAWSERYQEQVAAGQRAEAGYLEQKTHHRPEFNLQCHFCNPSRSSSSAFIWFRQRRHCPALSMM
ncbi:hypothetical protein ACSLOZ_29685, partial [Escherichia coli]